MLFIYIDESRSRSAKIGLNWRDPSNKSNPSLRLLMMGRLSPGLRGCRCLKKLREKMIPPIRADLVASSIRSKGVT